MGCSYFKIKVCLESSDGDIAFAIDREIVSREQSISKNLMGERMLFPTTVTVLQICMKTAAKSALCVKVRFVIFRIQLL